MKRIFIVLFAFFSVTFHSDAQSLLDLFDEDEVELQKQVVTNTFFSQRVINGQSVETPFPKNLIFVISHHFGSLNTGAYELWGLDQASIRIGFDYGITDKLSVSLGRSSFEKTYDGFFKYRILWQTENNKIPISATWFSGAYLKGKKWDDETRDYLFLHRMSYVHQLLIARKFSDKFSVQLTPAWVHKNLVAKADDFNNLFLMGIGSRIRVTKWVAVSGEYFYRFNVSESDNYRNSLSLGLDFDTGGHIFQLHFSNSKPMFERGFLTETAGNWLKGDIYFGFNITRVFDLRKKQKKIMLPGDVSNN